MAVDREELKRRIRERLGKAEEKPKEKKAPRKIPWKQVAVVLVAVICVAIGAVLIWTRPWERPSGEGEQGQGWQPPAGWRHFRSTAYIKLENTEDNLPIENVVIAGPFPETYDNLILQVASLGIPREGGGLMGWFHDSDIDYYENSLPEGREPPTFEILDNTRHGTRSLLRVDTFAPGEFLEVNWLYWAPENISLYDNYEKMELWENKWIWLLMGYQPSKSINAIVHFELFYEENYQNSTVGSDQRYLTWWEWQRQGWWSGPAWYYIESPW